MTGKSHQLIGLTAGIATYLLRVSPHYAPATFAAVIVASHLLALLPDIDSQAGLIWRSVPLGGVASHVVNPFLQHRNLTHSLLGAAVVGVLLRSLLHHFPTYWGIDGHSVLIAGLAAYFSHILADMVTVEGVPLFFPQQHMYGIPPRPFQGLRIVTGGWFENLVVFPAVNLVLIWLLWSQWPIIQLTLFRS
jgi:membrane-bound metal-dependent hydrolase YbcI (DUF457 family)